MLVLAAVTFAFFGQGKELRTTYSTDLALRVERTLTIDLRQKSLEAENKRKPIEIEARPEVAMSCTFHDVHEDRVLELAGDQAKKVRRQYVSADAQTLAGDPPKPRGDAQTSLFRGTTLVVAHGRAAEIVEPQTLAKTFAGALDGHEPDLALAALLPDREVDTGSSWNLDPRTILHGLGFDFDRTLFVSDAEQARKWDGHRSPRSLALLLDGLAWSGKCSVKSMDRAREGESCVVLALSLRGKADVDLGQPQRPSDPSIVLPKSRRADTEVTLEGELIYSPRAGRPVELTLSGPIEIQYRIQYEKNPDFTKSESSLAGKVELHVVVSDAR